MADVLHYEEFMPFLEASTAEPQPDGTILSRQRLDLPTFLGTRRLTARFRLARPTPTTYSVTWASLPGGEVRDQHGSFLLEPLGDKSRGTLVTCRFFLDPGGAAAFLVNPQTERSVGWILDGLRQHVRRGRYEGGRVQGLNLLPLLENTLRTSLNWSVAAASEGFCHERLPVFSAHFETS